MPKLEKEFYWTKKNDRLFRSTVYTGRSASPWICSSSDFNKSFRFSLMAGGYKIAADKLIDSIIETERRYHKLSEPTEKERLELLSQQREPELLIYPIVFSYRHYLELEMKGIIEGYGSLCNEQSIWNSHDLMVLWSKVKNIINSVRKDFKRYINHIPNIEKHITKINKIDPKSDIYRFPVNSKGKSALDCSDEKKHQYEIDDIDLQNLKKVMGRIFNYFIDLIYDLYEWDYECNIKPKVNLKNI